MLALNPHTNTTERQIVLHVDMDAFFAAIEQRDEDTDDARYREEHPEEGAEAATAAYAAEGGDEEQRKRYKRRGSVHTVDRDRIVGRVCGVDVDDYRLPFLEEEVGRIVEHVFDPQLGSHPLAARDANEEILVAGE